MMYSKGIAIIAITRNGVETAIKIKNALKASKLHCKVYAPSKYAQEDTVAFEVKLEDFVKDIYNTVSAVIGVMAMGIIIRAIAPHLENKLIDPAVVGVDASGKFAVSLLSGHYGGANELATLIAQGIGATPVVTTASDVMGKQSVDDLAHMLQLTIANPESIVPVNSAILNGDRTVLVSIGDVNVPTEKITGFEIKKAETSEQALEIVNSYDAGVIITREALPVATFVKPITIFKMQRITIGLGARPDTSTDQILRAITATLKKAKVSTDRVTAIATVDLKQESQNLMSAAMTLGFTLKFISLEDIRDFQHQDLSPDSKNVPGTVEVGGVCERTALIAAGKTSRLILKKTKLNGIIVALAAGE